MKKKVEEIKRTTKENKTRVVSHYAIFSFPLFWFRISFGFSRSLSFSKNNINTCVFIRDRCSICANCRAVKCKYAACVLFFLFSNEDIRTPCISKLLVFSLPSSFSLWGHSTGYCVLHISMYAVSTACVLKKEKNKEKQDDRIKNLSDIFPPSWEHRQNQKIKSPTHEWKCFFLQLRFYTILYTSQLYRIECIAMQMAFETKAQSALHRSICNNNVRVPHTSHTYEWKSIWSELHSKFSIHEFSKFRKSMSLFIFVSETFVIYE